MVTKVSRSLSAGQRKSSHRRRHHTPGNALAARLRRSRRYRQVATGTAGTPGMLGYPFDPLSQPTRTPDRQKRVEMYAEAVLLPHIYKALKADGIKWFPSDIAKIKRESSIAWGKAHDDLLSRFLASVYILDLAHATLEHIANESDKLDVFGENSTVAKQRLIGMLANLTGMRVSKSDGSIDEDAVKKILGKAGSMPLLDKLAEQYASIADDQDRRLVAALNRGAEPANRIDMAPRAAAATSPQPFNAIPMNELKSSLLYPFAYRPTVSYFDAEREGTRFDPVMRLADDVWAAHLFVMIRDGKFRPSNFSLTSRVHVFYPLGLETNMNPSVPNFRSVAYPRGAGVVFSSATAAQDAVAVDEIAVHDSGVSSAPASVGEPIRLASAYPMSRDTVDMNLLGSVNGTTIKKYEMETIFGRIQELTKSILEKLSSVEIYDDDNGILNVNTVPAGGSVPDDICGGTMPMFLGNDGNPVDRQFIRHNTSTRRYIVPSGVSWRCIGGSSGGAASAAQRRASAPGAKAVSLKQVEALPKKELAKFVQRIVNM